jgi:hypothetical protein
MIRKSGLKPVITLESHSEKQLWRMLANIKAQNLFAGLLD